ncbi:MAG: transcription elongation factor GreA [OCS116 cluster bacterium]|uniref:Transcription elongation factor GreA n=1 Tax=OCS116 cluster bacterium TaxID=2030921 RepID=A0A2A4YYF5_9PROT|nr:transcription elongation factor GreA [OCS116 cluster bacterium]
MEKIPMTIAGHAAMQADAKRRKSVDRPAIVNAISEARKHGDLSENAEYHAAKEDQGMNEATIQMLESNLALAEVIDVSKLSGDKIIFGATVGLVDEDTNEEVTYQIVGEAEADVKQGKISITSPIARALINKQVEDSAEVNTPGGGKVYEVLSIEFK